MHALILLWLAATPRGSQGCECCQKLHECQEIYVLKQAGSSRFLLVSAHLAAKPDTRRRKKLKKFKSAGGARKAFLQAGSTRQGRSAKIKRESP